MLRQLLCVVACAVFVLPEGHASAQPAFHSPAAPYYYRYTTYHRQVQLLDQQIRVREAEIAALERHLEAWEPLDRFRDGRPLMITMENTRLILMQAKFDLDRLERERFDLVHSRGY